MYYQAEVILPRGMTESDPQRQTLRLAKGFITHMLVGFPPGCQALARLQVFDKGWQLLPWTPGQSLGWDNVMLNFPFTYPLQVEPFEVVIRAWNLDDSYEHTLTVGVTMDEGQHDRGWLEFLQQLKEASV